MKALIVFAAATVIGALQDHRPPAQPHPAKVSCTTKLGAKILAGAKAQLKNPAIYDASYQSIRYPGGDVPADRGACTDVIIRAFRAAGMDLQKLVHDDIKRGGYPRVKRSDTNIDHRRVPNLVIYFKKHGETLKLSGWEAGDLVTWKLPGGLDHIGIISDQYGRTGEPMVIHNISVCAEEDVLGSWKIVGHFRAK